MVRTQDASAEFAKLHKVFTFHLGVATSLAWATSLYAGLHAPWVRNLAFLIDPTSSRQESTWAYLFTFPLALLVAWATVYGGRELLFRMRMMRNQLVEFAFAGAVMFVLFYAAVDRAIAALRLGWI
jgi:hypothetical protein